MPWRRRVAEQTSPIDRGPHPVGEGGADIDEKALARRRDPGEAHDRG